MKYIVILGDGMADWPFPGFGGKTALEAADKPRIDYMASRGILGFVQTVPPGMPPGSDTANMSVMGYDPKVYYSGRSPFEAASIGIDFDLSDVTFRCNLVTLEGEGAYDDLILADHSSDEITTEEAGILLEDVKKHFENDEISFYRGFSYRHIMIWHNGPTDWNLTPPHDILGKKVGAYMPKGSKGSVIEDMMRKSYEFLKVHPINLARVARGLRPANSVWMWGEGKKPALKNFTEKYGMSGTVISAVDLVKGIGKCADLDIVDVQGATGNIHTNYAGKVQAAFDALKGGSDFVYLHIEAPDECSHRFEPENKVTSIEYLDRKVVQPLTELLEKEGVEYRMMVLPDHATPLELRTHTGEPVPFLIYQNTSELPALPVKYDEKNGKDSGLFINEGHKLMDLFLSKEALRR